MSGEQIVILGGGMVGQLAGFFFPEAQVLDWRKTSPREKHLNGAKQFGAQYLWRPLPGIPCEKFRVVTTIDGEPATIDSIVRYKTKIGKASDLGRPDEDLLVQFPLESTGWRITELPVMPVQWGVYIERIDAAQQILHARGGQQYRYHRLISTVPLSSLLHMLQADADLGETVVDTGQFKYKPICVRTGPIPPDAPSLPDSMVRVNYISDGAIAAYRTTDRDGQRHYEWLQGSGGMGIPTKVLTPGKIWPHPWSEEWVQFLADHCRIHCFGRFPTWRPDELLHETYEHLRQLKQKLEV